MALSFAQRPWTRPGQTLASAGFSLAEVLVAGVVIVALLIASARLVSNAMAGGQQTAQRQRLEAEVASDLDQIRQLEQNQVSSVEAELSASSTVTPSPCSDPAAYLLQTVETALPERGGSSGSWTRTGMVTANGLLQITYNLMLPGSSQAETRVVEIAPAIQSACLNRSLGLR